MSADSTQAGVKRSSRPSLDGPEGQAKKTRRAQPSPPGSFRLPNAPPAAETPTLQDDSTPMEPTRQDTQPVESYQTNLAATDTLAQAGSGVEPLEDEPPILVWEQGILAYRRQVEQPLEASPNAQRIAALTKRHRVGGAYIHAFGIGHLNGVVNTGKDPNLRGNPRDLNISHVDNLFSVFSIPGSMRDYESPICLMVRRDLLHPDLLAAMRNADPRDPAANMPLLYINHEDTGEMHQLEEQLLSHIKDKRWMSKEELQVAEERLATLRSTAPLATLLNGLHRIQAILRLGKVAEEDHEVLLSQVRNQTVGPENMRAEMEEIQKRAKMASYRVDVFDSESPEELVNWLVRNEDSRPQMGMGPGEKAWWTGARWESVMRNARQEGATTRAQEAEKAFAEWSKDIGGAGLVLRSLSDSSSTGATPAKSSSRMKGDWAGPDAVSRLFTDPCTMEMVLDTRSALPVYNTVLRKVHSVAMVKSTGGLITARFWLACRTFLQIFNVAKGHGLPEAEQYLETATNLDSKGSAEAVGHWNNLHSHPQNTPIYMNFYDAGVQREFDDLYSAFYGQYELFVDIDWNDDSVLVQIRNIFETLGKRLQVREPEWCRRVGASLRLYARLPLAVEGPIAHGPTFVAASALPTKRWLDRLASEQSQFNLQGDGLTMFECMIDTHLPVWTVGAQTVGRSVNVHNWYHRSRGLHQILLRIVEAESFGTMDVRLDQAVSYLTGPELRIALRTIDYYLGDHFRTLMRDYCVLRSHPMDYPFLSRSPEMIESYGGLPAIHTAISMARSELKALLFAPGPSYPTLAQYADLIKWHPVLYDLLSDDFFDESFPAALWIHGWNSAPEKRYRDINSLIMWGCLSTSDDYEILVEQLMIAEKARPLLDIVLFLHELSGSRPWWITLNLPIYGGPATWYNPAVLSRDPSEFNSASDRRLPPPQEKQAVQVLQREGQENRDHVAGGNQDGTDEQEPEGGDPEKEQQAQEEQEERGQLGEQPGEQNGRGKQVGQGKRDERDGQYGREPDDGQVKGPGDGGISNIPRADQQQANQRRAVGERLQQIVHRQGICETTGAAVESVSKAAELEDHQNIVGSREVRVTATERQSGEAQRRDDRGSDAQSGIQSLPGTPSVPPTAQPSKGSPSNDAGSRSLEAPSSPSGLAAVNVAMAPNLSNLSKDPLPASPHVHEPDGSGDTSAVPQGKDLGPSPETTDNPPCSDETKELCPSDSSAQMQEVQSTRPEFVDGAPRTHATLETSPGASEPNPTDPSPTYPILVISPEHPLAVSGPSDSPHVTDERVSSKDACLHVSQHTPAHIMTPAMPATGTLDFVLGVALFNEYMSPTLASQIIERNAQRLDSIGLCIISERQKLRQSIETAARHCVEAEYGGYFAQAGLSAVISAYKDIFVARVSRTLQQELKMTQIEAINAATAMATSDGLFDAEIACFNNGQGELSIDLSKTFALGIQDQLDDGRQFVRVGTVPGCQEDRDHIWSIMKWFHPILGIGQTQQESQVRGKEAALMQHAKISYGSQIPARLVAVTVPDHPPPREPKCYIGFPDRTQVEDQWGFQECEPLPQGSLRTVQPEHSTLSMGVFLDPEHRRTPIRLRSEKAHLTARALEVAMKAQDDWRSAQALDKISYEHWRNERSQLSASSPSRTIISAPVESDATYLATSRAGTHELGTQATTASYDRTDDADVRHDNTVNQNSDATANKSHDHSDAPVLSPSSTFPEAGTIPVEETGTAPVQPQPTRRSARIRTRSKA